MCLAWLGLGLGICLGFGCCLCLGFGLCFCLGLGWAGWVGWAGLAGFACLAWWFEVWGLGSLGCGCWPKALKLMAQGLGFWGLEFRVLWFRVQGLGFVDLGFGV